MKITFCLAWLKTKNLERGSYKSAAARNLFDDYFGRLSKFTPCAVSNLDFERKRPGASKLWICDNSSKAKQLSSEGLSAQIQNLLNSGIKELCIGIGPSDGFKAEHIKKLEPDLLWSFGLLTLPHELAGVVAAEQLYRAFTIIHNYPYHTAH